MAESGQLPLADRVVLVTGAARRIGAVLARAFHGAGARIAIHYHRSTHEAQELTAELNSLRPLSAVALQADLANLDAIGVLPAEAVGSFGRLDVLVNNASTFYPTPVGSITAAQFDDLIATNFRAPLFLSQAAAPELASRSGLILNIADIHALRPLVRHPVYSAAKAALVMLTRALARELGPRVRVNAIAGTPAAKPMIAIAVMWLSKAVNCPFWKHAATAGSANSSRPHIAGSAISRVVRKPQSSEREKPSRSALTW